MGCAFCSNPLCVGACASAILSNITTANQLYRSTFDPRALRSPGLPWLAVDPSQPTKAEPLEKAGMKVEDLIGWRIWELTPLGLLKSFSQHSIWIPGEPMTGDPGDYTDAGVWAFRDYWSAANKLREYPAHVMGSVRLWGQVVEHENGYRAEFARIVSLDAIHLPGMYPWDEEVQSALSWLRGRYGLTNAKSAEPGCDP